MVVWNLKSFKFDQCRREAFLHPSVWKLFRPMLLFIDSLHYFRAPFSKRTWLLRAVTSHRSKITFENVFLGTARYNQMTGNCENVNANTFHDREMTFCQAIYNMFVRCVSVLCYRNEREQANLFFFFFSFFVGEREGLDLCTSKRKVEESSS